MKKELKSGIAEFDSAVERFENGEINFINRSVKPIHRN